MREDVQQEARAFQGKVVEMLRQRFPEAIPASGSSLDQTWLRMVPDQLVEVCTFLRDHAALRFEYLRDLCGVDRLGLAPAKERFQVVYQPFSFEFGCLLRLEVDLPEKEPEVDSVSGVWPAAEWHEREVFDMYGVGFRGHPDLRRILMPEAYRHHPLRKDFPLEGFHDIEGV